MSIEPEEVYEHILEADDDKGLQFSREEMIKHLYEEKYFELINALFYMS